MAGLVPPGVWFLAQILPRLAAPPLAVVIFARLYPLSLSPWLVLLACCLSIPIVFTISVQYDSCRKWLKARRMGAVLPTPIEHKVPGSFDALASMKEAHETRFPGHAFSTYALKYGPTYNVRLLFRDRYFTCDPECIKIVLSSKFTSYEKGAVFRSTMRNFLGDGVFNADGEMWKFHRAMSRPFFARDRISHFDIFDRHTEEAIRYAKARMSEGVPIDFQELAARITLDSASEFLLGTDIRSLSAPLSYPPSSSSSSRPRPSSSSSSQPSSSSSYDALTPTQAFAHAFNEAQSITALRGYFGPLWPLSEFWADELEGPMRAIDRVVVPLVEGVVRRARVGKVDGKSGKETGKERENGTIADRDMARESKEPDGEVEEGETLLEHLVKVTDDPQIIKDAALNILLAGRDTTATTVTFAVYVLSQHPDILKRLRAEIMECVGPTRRPTFDDIKNMRYLRAFINEILRLYPPVPFDVRAAVADGLWPSNDKDGRPFFVEAGTEVLYSVLVMHRRTDLWGPDAAKFDPDRFLDERCQKYLVPNPFIFLPFNGGPRICLGQQFAYNEASFIAIRLLQHFTSFELAQEEANPAAAPTPGWAASSPGTDGTDRVKPRMALVMYVEGGLWVRMKAAHPNSPGEGDSDQNATP